MRNKVKRWMKNNLHDYVDECGEYNCTLLAENACQEFNLYKGDDIPEWLFDMAVGVTGGIDV